MLEKLKQQILWVVRTIWNKIKNICCKVWDKVKNLWNKWVNWIFKGFYK